MMPIPGCTPVTAFGIRESMVQTVEAIYGAGVLKRLEALPLADQQRVRVTIEAVDARPPCDASWTGSRRALSHTGVRFPLAKSSTPVADGLYRRHLACALVSFPMQAGSLRYATIRLGLADQSPKGQRRAAVRSPRRLPAQPP